jgi:ATP-dependent Lon protease
MMANEEQASQKLSTAEAEVPKELPVLPLENVVVYPFMVTPLQVSGEQSLQLIADVIEKERILALVAQRNPEEEDEFDPDNLYRIGTAASIIKMAKIPDGSAMILIQGVCRLQITDFIQPRPYIKAHVKCLQDEPGRQKTVQALMSNMSMQFEKLVSLVPHLPDELKIAITNNTDPSRQADLVASNLRLTLVQRQEILETLNIQQRLEKVTKLLSTELEVLELGSKIQNQVESQMGKTQREYYLREQLKAIQNELGEEDEVAREIRQLREKLEEKEMPEKSRVATERELDRLSRMPAGAGEYTVARTYVDWMLTLPWKEETEDMLDIKASKKILDEDHFNLEKIKERIIEYLAVRRLKKDMKGPILCFAGPPGVGKTSLGKSIARALGRKFVRISLGGVRDEAEIRGHRRTYVGSLPGRIIQALREAGSRNPVFMLDEVDKLGADFRGDPSSALLEVLDPEQNDTFSDHYLDVPFDLSQVMFIATANLLETIPPPLRDRMEVLEIPGYMREDKVKIAQKFIVPKQLKMHGIQSKNLTIYKSALVKIIGSYTRESGLRNLEREVASICRKAARKVAEGYKGKIKITPENLSEFLGPEKFYAEVAERTSVPGVVTGLAWTMTGGEILFIESTRMKGGKGFTVTGQLGDVMKESARAALSWVRSKAPELMIDPDIFDNNDIHIHIPAGAIPKDGPSAGITIASSLVSLLTDRTIRSDVAMTGEITLRGKVLPVGGIKEKLLAAHRANIKTVILPNHNEKDTLELPDKVKKGLRLVFVESMDEVVRVAFEKKPKHTKTVKKKAMKKKSGKK